MNIGLRCIWLAAVVAGCGETVQAERVAEIYACEMQDRIVQNSGVGRAAVEEIVVSTGVLSRADLEDGKRVLSGAAQAVQTQIPEAVGQIAAVAPQVNCQTVVGTAGGLLRSAAAALK